MTEIKLINGKILILLDLTDFQNPAHRVDPSTLQTLPEGITLDILIATAQHAKQTGDADTCMSLGEEIYVRSMGYIPHFGPDQRDQFGYNFEGLDAEGRNHFGLSPEEASADPMMDERPRTDRYAAGTDEPDKRQHTKGMTGNKGNIGGQTIVSNDGTERNLGHVWYDLFIANEAVTVQNRMTDEEIAERMMSLFPSRTFNIKTVRYNRWRFNRCELPIQQLGASTPLVSYRYMKMENILHRVTPRGRSLQQWDLTDVSLGEQFRGKAKSRTTQK